MSNSLSKYSTRIVGLLVLVEAVSVYLLWTLSAVGQADEGVFAIFLAISLVALAMISNIYRTLKEGDQLGRGFLIAGCGLILLLIYVSLAI
jgi:predicted membrane channel-forming protein YqfA (hemolysin III family)